MNFLDKKVEEILKNHSSGEDFFNHLDDMIRGHKSIIDATWDKLVQWCYDEHLWVNRGIPTFGWNGSKIPIGGEERSIPWGDSVIEVINNAISIDVDTLLQLIKDSEKLAALEAEGVDNWEGYSLAMKELNTGYQKDAITDEVLIKQYCE